MALVSFSLRFNANFLKKKKNKFNLIHWALRANDELPLEGVAVRSMFVFVLEHSESRCSGWRSFL